MSVGAIVVNTAAMSAMRRRGAQRAPLGREARGRAVADEELAKRRRNPLRDDDSGAAADRGEHERLDQKLRRESASACADGESHGDLALPAKHARDHQVGDVRAGDEEHDGGDAGHPQHGLRFEAGAGAGCGLERAGDGAGMRNAIRQCPRILRPLSLATEDVRPAQLHGGGLA